MIKNRKEFYKLFLQRYDLLQRAETRRLWFKRNKVLDQIIEKEYLMQQIHDDIDMPISLTNFIEHQNNCFALGLSSEDMLVMLADTLQKAEKEFEV